MNKALIHRVQARNDELDAFGHVNHAAYLHYLEDARWAALENWGYSLQELLSRGWSIVVTEMWLSYKAPAYGRDELEVHTSFGPRGRIRSLWKQRLFCLGDGKLLLDARITGAFLDERGRPVRIPEDLREHMMRYAD